MYGQLEVAGRDMADLADDIANGLPGVPGSVTSAVERESRAPPEDDVDP